MNVLHVARSPKEFGLNHTAAARTIKSAVSHLEAEGCIFDTSCHHVSKVSQSLKRYTCTSTSICSRVTAAVVPVATDHTITTALSIVHDSWHTVAARTLL